MQEDVSSLEITRATESHWRPYLTQHAPSVAAKVSWHKKDFNFFYWLLSTICISFNKLQLVSGHFTKDCFSAPGLQYALLPEEDDEVPQQQTSTVKPQQDSDKKKKKKVTVDVRLDLAPLHFSLYLLFGGFVYE